jgi:hypothetical protein
MRNSLENGRYTAAARLIDYFSILQVEDHDYGTVAGAGALERRLLGGCARGGPFKAGLGRKERLPDGERALNQFSPISL